MSYKNLPYPKASAIDSREESKRKKLADIRRGVFVRESSKTAPQLSSNTLSICRQENKYFLDCVELWLTCTQRELDEQQIASLKYNQYLESLNSLLHNINFINNAKNFGTKNKTGQIIDINYLKSSNFAYNTDIRSIFGSKTKFRPIKNESQLSDMLIYVLETSQQIVEDFEQELDVDLLKQSNPAIETKLEKYQIVKNKLFGMAQNLIISLKNNKINLDAFSEIIAFEDKKTSGFNKF